MAFDIKIFRSKIFKDVFIFQPSIGSDKRGTIFTTYDSKIYDKFLPANIHFVHDKFAESNKNVLRGLHGDNKTWKLVSCILGNIYEVVVDMREDSPTYLRWDAFVLNDKNNMQVLIPPNFVNGYYIMSEKAIFHYKLAYDGKYFDVKEQNVIKWNDKRIKILWPCVNPILSMRDK